LGRKGWRCEQCSYDGNKCVQKVRRRGKGKIKKDIQAPVDLRKAKEKLGCPCAKQAENSQKVGLMGEGMKGAFE